MSNNSFHVFLIAGRIVQRQSIQRKTLAAAVARLRLVFFAENAKPLVEFSFTTFTTAALAETKK